MEQMEIDVDTMVKVLARQAVAMGADEHDSNDKILIMLHNMGMDDPFAWYAVRRAIRDLKPRTKRRIGFIQ